MKKSQKADFLSLLFLLALISTEFSADVCLKQGRKNEDFCVKQGQDLTVLPRLTRPLPTQTFAEYLRRALD